ncbi:MAG: tetratricopeptide repeat protein [Candidatus Eremiobacteraeota bacterium]|nr:tetratricopeptide repeat protein [Candidatus Eremiobacteraeota bacterium]
MGIFSKIAILVGVLVLGAPLCAAAQAVTHTIDINPGLKANTDFSSDPQAAIDQARQRVAAGDLAGAIRGLATYTAAHPTETAPARLLGDLYYRQGDLRMAETTYKGILAFHSGDRETHNRLGSVFATQNRINDAISEFENSLPGTDSIGDLVELHQQRGDLPAYKKRLEKAAFDQPTDSDAQTELAEAYAALHDPANAVLFFARALDNAPNSLLALNGLGMAYMDERNYLEAVKTFAKCRGLDPRNFPCTLNTAATYLEMKDLAAAQVQLDTAHSMAPERPETQVNYGYLADAQGNWKGAVSDYLRALLLSPYSREAYFDLGLDYDQHKLYSLAQSVLIKGITVAPEDGRMHFMLGKTYADQHQNDLAIAQFKTAAASTDPTISSLAQEQVASLLAKH